MMRSVADQTLREFAERYRLKLRRDECGGLFVSGKRGQVYEYGPGQLAAMFLSDSRRQWSAARKKLAESGFRIMQDAATEGSALFDPDNTDQCRMAIRVIRAKPRRILSAAQQEHLQAAREKAAVSRNRQKVYARGGFSENFESPATGTAPGASQPESKQSTP